MAAGPPPPAQCRVRHVGHVSWQLGGVAVQTGAGLGQDTAWSRGSGRPKHPGRSRRFAPASSCAAARPRSGRWWRSAG